MCIHTVKTNPSDCPPREKQAALRILAATCWAINTHTALEKIPRIMVLCEKDGINAEREGREEILWGKKDLHLQKNNILSFHRWWNKMLTNIVSSRTWIHITSDKIYTIINSFNTSSNLKQNVFLSISRLWNKFPATYKIFQKI